jgi:hypothetical protein
MPQSPRRRRVPSSQPDLSARFRQLRSNISVARLRNSRSSSSSPSRTNTNHPSHVASTSSSNSTVPSSSSSRTPTSSATSQSSIIPPIPDPPSTNPSSTVINPTNRCRQQVLPLARQPLVVNRVYLLDIGDCNIICPHCNAFHWIHELSSKGTQRLPSFHTCCSDGRISLPPLSNAPPHLHWLLSSQHPGNSYCYL